MKFDVTYYKIYEKYVNSVENIYIDEVGEFPAESDTGNSGYNVIHGEDIETDGDRITFTTVNGKILTRPIEEFIIAVTGSSDQEQRPVVKLNVTIRGQKINDTLFSVSNRKTNDKKILLSKDFLKKIADFVKI